MKMIILFFAFIIIMACSKSSKQEEILFEEAVKILKEQTNVDTISSEALLKLKTIMLDYSDTKLAKQLEYETVKIQVSNSKPLSFHELINLDRELRSMIQENHDEITDLLMHFGATSKAYYRTPKSHGGGGRQTFRGLTDSWLNFTKVLDNRSQPKCPAKYTVVQIEDSFLILQGESKYWKIQLEVRSDVNRFKIISTKRKK